MKLFNHENLQVSHCKDKKACRFIKGFFKYNTLNISDWMVFKERLYKYTDGTSCLQFQKNHKGSFRFD